jgi:hypothetical protein
MMKFITRSAWIPLMFFQVNLLLHKINLNKYLEYFKIDFQMSLRRQHPRGQIVACHGVLQPPRLARMSNQGPLPVPTRKYTGTLTID